MTTTEAPIYATGDCHVGDCQRPVDHAGRHGKRTATEQAAAGRRSATLVTAQPEPDWNALYREYAERQTR
jgi:hypothetical protein